MAIRMCQFFSSALPRSLIILSDVTVVDVRRGHASSANVQTWRAYEAGISTDDVLL